MNAGFLLDTNIVSDTRRARPDEGVIAFLGSQPSSSLFLSALTIGELRKGVAIKRRTDGRAAESIAAWIDAIESTFGDRILPIDNRIARRWGELAAERTRPVVDTLIAATAFAHGLTLVTRNISDMSGLEVEVLDPFVAKDPRR